MAGEPSESLVQVRMFSGIESGAANQASSREQLELHLQVAVFLVWAVAAAPFPVPDEEPPEAVHCRARPNKKNA